MYIVTEQLNRNLAIDLIPNEQSKVDSVKENLPEKI